MNSFFVFLLFLAFGLIFGSIYDIFGIVRKWVGVTFVFFLDILYFLIFSVFTFYMCILLNAGHVRYFIIQASFAGIILYKFTIGKQISNFLKKFFRLFIRKNNCSLFTKTQEKQENKF